MYTGLSGDISISLANNGDLTLGDGLMIVAGTTIAVAETNGNPVAIAGGVTYDKNNAPPTDFGTLSSLLSSCTNSSGCTLGGILPVTLSSWAARPGDKEDRVVLTWSSASEDDNDYFFIEHGTDGINFQEVARLSGQGGATTGGSYVYEHTNLTGGEHFYRLGQRDFDGTTAGSIFAPLSFSKPAPWLHFPTLFKQEHSSA